MDPLLATILLWPVNFAPNGWALCAGQLLSISQNAALFSLIGTTYGGNGTVNFALPDFQGRVPVGAGNGVGLSPYVLGQKGGTENVTLTINNMPAHTHTLTILASNANATASAPSPTVNTLAAIYDTVNASPISGYNNATPNTQLKVSTNNQTGITGNGIPIPVLQPYLAVNYIIALQGVFPTRP